MGQLVELLSNFEIDGEVVAEGTRLEMTEVDAEYYKRLGAVKLLQGGSPDVTVLGGGQKTPDGFPVKPVIKDEPASSSEQNNQPTNNVHLG